MRKVLFLLFVLLLPVRLNVAQEITEGTLFAFGKEGDLLGACPLKHTSVQANISGFLARVKVIHEFENSFSVPIEAVYKFPLSQNSAVDSMIMKIGQRTIRGQIRRREEAQQIYEKARSEGKTAGLLNQERPNVFTQAVANILPYENILVEISYVETLRYEEGSYEFVFPMTIGERYIPSSVTDASNISPPIAKTRAGHQVSLEVNLDAGVPIEEIRSTSHEIEILNISSGSARISLKQLQVIPNKDFILRYDVTGKHLTDALLTHQNGSNGFFKLILQPPDRFGITDVSPKEIVFVLDTSGSMSGFPLEKAKESMRYALQNLNPQDTFNLITFSGDTHILFEKPVAATPENLLKAQRFLESRSGSGGTEMMKAIRAALMPTRSQEHIRIVCFMTDGYVGNEAEIIAEIQRYPNARVFSFGIGSSVNRYLLDKMAEEGRGEVEYVSLNDDGSKAARRFYERVRYPLLTDISIDWNGLPVEDIYPKKINDLFSSKPVIVYGRYTKAASGTIKLKGKAGNQIFYREISVNLPWNQTKHDVLATLWARTKIDDLTRTDYLDRNNEIRESITELGLQYGLLTKFTSFVAVEEQIRNVGGELKTVEVPVEIPEGSFGTPATSVSKVPLVATISGGIVNGKALNLVKPTFPVTAKSLRVGGTVAVLVVIDESGQVISSVPVSGHPLLRTAATQAAMSSKFAPTLLSGQPVKTSGVIIYNFDNPDGFNMKAQNPLKRLEILHPWLVELVGRLKSNNKARTTNESRFVRQGKALLKINLALNNPSILNKLKKIGAEMISIKGQEITIKIPVEQIESLTKIPEVRYAEPLLK